MIKEMVFGTVGGLGLFLFGMGQMSDGLKKAAGQKLKKVLESMTRNAFLAFLVGLGVTALIQSSSATTVMVVGFVNAGLLTLKQAICVVIGTNVGTTMTAWLVSISGIEMGAFKVTSYALPAIGIGFVLYVAGRSRRIKNLGQIILGFGLLFVGIGFMKDAFEVLEKSEKVQKLFVSLGGHPYLAILAGTIVTMLLQSSSASIAVVQLLAIGGAFGSNWETALNVSIPFVVGGNIGTTITAQIAAVGTNLGARRTAWAHTVFNILGAIIALPFIYLGWFAAAVKLISPWELSGTTVAASIAVAHTMFNVINSAIFLPLASILEKIVTFLVRQKPSDFMIAPVVLEEHLLNTPPIAIDQVRREIVLMAKHARDAINYAISGLFEAERLKFERARKTEDVLDEFQYEITCYLSRLSQKEISEEVSVELPFLLHSVNDLERVGDHAVNIVEIAERKIENKVELSDFAQAESVELRNEISQMVDRIVTSLENNDHQAAEDALVNEANLNRMQVEFRQNHVQRITDGTCSAVAGLIFIDFVDNVEKIGDHLTNIAQATLGGPKRSRVHKLSDIAEVKNTSS
ncbi:MAG: Na/Pi cotransporter family protein [Planctomycetota bacterium]